MVGSVSIFWLLCAGFVLAWASDVARLAGLKHWYLCGAVPGAIIIFLQGWFAQ